MDRGNRAVPVSLARSPGASMVRRSHVGAPFRKDEVVGGAQGTVCVIGGGSAGAAVERGGGRDVRRRWPALNRAGAGRGERWLAPGRWAGWGGRRRLASRTADVPMSRWPGGSAPAQRPAIAPNRSRRPAPGTLPSVQAGAGDRPQAPRPG